MDCTGLSVVRGTAISSVRRRGARRDRRRPGRRRRAAARARVRARRRRDRRRPGLLGLAGPLRTGVRAGAISESDRRVRQQGRSGHADRGDPRRPAAAPARRAGAPRPCCAPRTSLAGPLTVSGLSPRARSLLARAAARTGRTVLAAPPGPLGGFPAQDLRPGAAVSRRRCPPATSRSARSAPSPTATATRSSRSATARRARPARAVPPGRLRLRGDQQPARRAGPGDVTYKLASSGGHPLGGDHQRHVLRDRRQHRSRPALDPAARVGAQARRRRRRVVLDSRLADERDLDLGAGDRPDRPAGGVHGARPAARLASQPGRHDRVHALPGARAAPADRLLQPLLRQLRRRSTDIAEAASAGRRASTSAALHIRRRRA